jgi:hypothetical protein
MLHRMALCAAICSVGLVADTLLLTDGKTVEGTYLGGDSRTVRMAVDDNVQTFGIEQVSSIRFGSAIPAAAPKPAKRVSILRPEPALPAAAATSQAASRREVPSGSSLVIRMIDDVDSSRHTVGKTFRASLDEPAVVDGTTLIPRNADVELKLVDDKQAGKLSGRTELTLNLISVTVDGRPVAVQTGEVTERSESRTRQTATRTGGGAALGAVIGAIAGGGKGAAIGAVTGAAAGGAVQVLTKGPQVRIPSETRLTFTLSNPLVL